MLYSGMILTTLLRMTLPSFLPTPSASVILYTILIRRLIVGNSDC